MEAAKKLFSENGFSAVSTRKIAKTAEVNEVTLFRLFETKEKLFEATINYFLFRPNFNEIVQLKEADSETFLRELGQFLHRFFTENLTMIKIEIRNQDKLLKEKSINKFPNEIRELLAGQFHAHKGLSEEQADIEAICFMTALHGICLHLYVFETFAHPVAFEDCLASIVSKFI